LIVLCKYLCSSSSSSSSSSFRLIFDSGGEYDTKAFSWEETNSHVVLKSALICFYCSLLCVSKRCDFFSLVQSLGYIREYQVFHFFFFVNIIFISYRHTIMSVDPFTPSLL